MVRNIVVVHRLHYLPLSYGEKKISNKLIRVLVIPFCLSIYLLSLKGCHKLNLFKGNVIFTQLDLHYLNLTVTMVTPWLFSLEKKTP